MDRARWAESDIVENPGRPAPLVVRLAKTIGFFFTLWHRPTLEGVENLPRSGAFVLVGNHPMGFGATEITSFIVLYLRAFGAERPLAGFAHPAGFRLFPLSRALRGIGAIPSTYGAAVKVLAAGVPIFVYPGGDHEGLRPIWQANRVDLAGRVGFLRIARAAGVPIVPIGFRGACATPLLLRSRLLATLLVVPRVFGLKRWSLSILGAVGAIVIVTLSHAAWPLRLMFVWLWLATPLTFLPWLPWTLRLRIGEPMPASELFAKDADDKSDDDLTRALGRVQAAVQTLVDP